MSGAGTSLGIAKDSDDEFIDDAIADDHIDYDSIIRKPIYSSETMQRFRCTISDIENELVKFGLSGLRLRGDMNANITEFLSNNKNIYHAHYDLETSVRFLTFVKGDNRPLELVPKAKQELFIFDDRDSLNLSGSYNIIRSYKTVFGEKRIIRTMNPRMSIIDSFKENLKHIILHIIFRYCGINYGMKFVPDVYFMGVSIDKTQLFLVMERGNMTLGDYFRSIPTDYTTMRNTMFSIFRSLEILNRELGLHFKHNDLKENNILISIDKKPLLIDFGSSQFQIEDVLFASVIEKTITYDNDGINITHDMMQLFSSLALPVSVSLTYSHEPVEYVFDIFKIFNFVQGKRSYILNGEIMKEFMAKFMSGFAGTSITIIPYEKFYFRPGRKVFLTELVPLLLGSDVSLVITSEELAANLGLSASERTDINLFEKYKSKYLKYKSKYLKLKNRKHNILNYVLK